MSTFMAIDIRQGKDQRWRWFKVRLGNDGNSMRCGTMSTGSWALYSAAKADAQEWMPGVAILGG